MQELAGKVAVVTGGGSGIGSGLVAALAEAGMHVVVADIELDAATIVADHGVEQGIEAHAVVQVDVTDVESVRALADRARTRRSARCTCCATTRACSCSARWPSCAPKTGGGSTA